MITVFYHFLYIHIFTVVCIIGSLMYLKLGVVVFVMKA